MKMCEACKESLKQDYEAFEGKDIELQVYHCTNNILNKGSQSCITNFASYLFQRNEPTEINYMRE